MIENTQRGSNRLFIRNVDLDEANQLIKVSHIEKLFIYNNHKIIFIRDLQLEGMENIRWLYIEQNNCYSIESLHRIKMRVLERFKIKQPYITCGRDLIKGYWPQLVSLVVCLGKMKEIDLSAISTRKVRWMTVAVIKKQGLVKVDSSSLRQINVPQPRNKQFLQKKFLHCKISLIK